MKALTLTQPWASLVALGAKRIETLSWGTAYRGPLAIHAGWGFPSIARRYVELEPIRSVLEAAGLAEETLPRGLVVATCQLVDCFHVDGPTWSAIEPELVRMRHEPSAVVEIAVATPDGRKVRVGRQELAMGDFGPGRHLWVLEEVDALSRPLSARGRQGLWNWPAPRAIGGE